MSKEERDTVLLAGFEYVRRWYPASVKRLGVVGRRQLVADVLWDQMVNTLLFCAKRFNGKGDFTRYLAWCLRRARRNTLKWYYSQKRGGRKTFLHQLATSTAMDRPDPRDDFARVDARDFSDRCRTLIGDSDLSALSRMVEGPIGDVAAAEGVTRQAIYTRYHKLLGRLRGGLDTEAGGEVPRHVQNPRRRPRGLPPVRDAGGG